MACSGARSLEWRKLNPDRAKAIHKRCQAQRGDKASKYSKARRRTKPGFLEIAYSNMRGRVRGKDIGKANLYDGLNLVGRADFYAWALESEMFHKLFDEYARSGYQQKLAPTVDRIDSSSGYEFWNMEWVTHSENSRRGAISRWSALPYDG